MKLLASLCALGTVVGVASAASLRAGDAIEKDGLKAPVDKVVDPHQAHRTLMMGYDDYTNDKPGFVAAIGTADWTVGFDNPASAGSFENETLTVYDEEDRAVFTLEQVGGDLEEVRDLFPNRTRWGFNSVSVRGPPGHPGSLALITTQYGTPGSPAPTKINVDMKFLEPVKAVGFDAFFTQIDEGTIVDIVVECPSGKLSFETPQIGFWGIVFKDGDYATKITFMSKGPDENGDRNWEAWLMDNVMAVDVSRRGGVFGDPHFLTWGGQWFDFMGECDLVLLDAPDFKNGLGLVVQVRTKIRHDYSYIEAAAVKIGNDTLEVGGYGEYFVNGVQSSLETMPATLSGFAIKHTEEVDAGRLNHFFDIEIGSDRFIHVSSHKELVSIKFDHMHGTGLMHSKGLMGDFGTGVRFARDGKTILHNDDEFGQEWQVRDTDEKLFVSDSGPQYPDRCVMPSAALVEEKHRRLGETISRVDAEAACAHLTNGFEQCVYDVMVTGDLAAAQAAEAF